MCVSKLVYLMRVRISGLCETNGSAINLTDDLLIILCYPVFLMNCFMF